MPAPSTNDELLGLVQKSGLADEPRLTEYVEQLRADSSLPAEPQALANLLVRDGVLTVFQAGQLLQGRWRGYTIGKYKVLEKLGSGGMGQVYLCEHKVMRRKVAVKVLPSAKARDPHSLQRFHREGRAIAALDHPNLVRAFDIDEQEDESQNTVHYLVMEYVDGTSLQELVKKVGPLDPTRACHYVYYAALGLQYAYEVAELIHRDVKPGNIMVDRQGAVKLLDMGLARFFNDETDILTQKVNENVLGTADYLSPEQAIDSHDVDIRADIYSLGATFYYLLSGHAPFPEGNVAQKLIAHQTRQPKPVRLERPEVPMEMATVLERMMAKDPAARYQTPAELAGELAPFVQTPIPPPTEDEMPRLSRAATGTATVGSRETVGRRSGGTTVGQRAALAGALVATAPVNDQAGGAGSPPPGPIPTSPSRQGSNPFAQIIAGSTGTGPHNVYATAAARTPAVLTPAAPLADRPPARPRRVARRIARLLGLVVLAAVAYGALRLAIVGPAGWF
jgi:serine/threonine protein kinase